MKNWVLTVAVLTAFLTPFMVSSVNIALPAIGKEFGLGAVQLNWVPLSYLLMAAMLLVPFGRLADLWGKMRVFGWGVGVFTAASLLCAMAQGAVSLLLARVLQGAGSAMIFGTAMALVADVFPPGERGRALGLNVAAVYTGLSLGPTLGGFLTQQAGWRSLFLAVVPLGILTLLVAAFRLRGVGSARAEGRFDHAGASLFALSILAFMYGLSLLPSRGGAGLILLGIVSGTYFVRREEKAPSPMVNIRLFRENTVFAFSNLAALINYSSTFAVGFLMSLFLQYIRGFTPQQAGMVLVAQPVVMAVFSPLAGWASDRVEPRIVASLGMGMSFLGVLLLGFLTPATPIPLIIGTLAFLGLGFALFSSPNANAVMSSVERRDYGVASATLATTRLLGQMMSMGLATLVFALFLGNARITPDLHPAFLKSLAVSFHIFAALCVLGVFASLARGNLRKG